MTLFSPAANPQSQQQQGRLGVYLLSGLFVMLGIGAIAWLITAIARDGAIQMARGVIPATDGTQPSLIIAFLTEFGIVLPLLTLGLGSLSIWLGLQLRTQNVIAARWAQVALAWLMVGAAVIAGFHSVRTLLTVAFAPPDPGAPAQEPTFVLPLSLALGALALFGLILRWLNRHINTRFYGQEQLSSRETRLAWSLLVPTLAVFLLVAARPLEQTFIRSLTDKRFAGGEVPNYVGLQNYQELMSVRIDRVACRVDDATGGCVTRDDGTIRWQSIDRELLEEGFRTVWNLPWPFGATPQSLAVSGLDADFLQSVWTTVLFTVLSVSLELLIALFIALTVNSAFRGRGMMRAVMLIPWAIPTVVSARLWELMLKDTSAGIINRVLMDFNVIDAPKAWLADVSLQLSTVVLVDAWKTAPFMALLLLAGLQSIPKDLYEAADVDGANRFNQFWSVTLPLLRPTIAVALIFRTLDSLRVFDLFNVLFGRQKLSMATYNYETLVNNQQDGYASAISIILFVLISLFAFMYVRVLYVEADG